jgi:hypothetical protein
MLIENAKYGADPEGNNTCVICDIDGEHSAVPMDVGNRHYAEIQRQVAAGDLTIADAD